MAGDSAIGYRGLAMSRTAWLALFLAASHLLTAIVTCSSSQRTALDVAAPARVAPVSHSLPSQDDGRAGDAIHARHHAGEEGGDEVPPCHAPALALKAPCPCGCDGGAPVARSGLFGFGEMLLAWQEDPGDEGRPLPIAARPLPLPASPPSPVEHVPIFA